MYKLPFHYFYASPLEEFHDLLWNKLLEKYGSVNKVALVFDMSIRQLYKWKEQIASYPLTALHALASDIQLSVEGNLDYLKTRMPSEPLRNPRITFQPSLLLAEFFGHLLHDGGIDSNYRVHYTTHSRTAADRFAYLIHSCFGVCKVSSRQFANKTCMYFPAIVGFVINHTFGIPVGSKVKNDVAVPDMLYQADSALQWRYIVSAAFCDGLKDRVGIVSCSSSQAHPPNLLLGLQQLFSVNGIRSLSVPSERYKVADGSIHRRWVLRIPDRKDKEEFRKHYAHYVRLLLQPFIRRGVQVHKPA